MIDRYRNFDPCKGFDIPNEEEETNKTNKPVMNNMSTQETFTLVVSSTKPVLRGSVPIYVAINDEQGNHLALHCGNSWVITITYRLFDEIWYAIRHIYGERFSEALSALRADVDTKYTDMVESSSTSPKQHRDLLDAIKLLVAEYERTSNNRQVPPIDMNIQTLIRIFEWNIKELEKLVKQ